MYLLNNHNSENSRGKFDEPSAFRLQLSAKNKRVNGLSPVRDPCQEYLRHLRFASTMARQARWLKKETTRDGVFVRDNNGDDIRAELCP